MKVIRPARTSLSAILGGIVLVMAGMLLSAGTVRAESIPKQLAVPGKPEGNAACLECHVKADHMTRGGKDISVQVDGKAFDESVHGILSCVRCHAEAAGPEHAKDPKKPLPVPPADTRERKAFQSAECVKCHAGVYEQSYNLSLHGVAAKHGDIRAATCVDCHGVHNVLPARNPDSSVAKEHLVQTCGQSGCHQNAPASFANGKEHFVPAQAETSGWLHTIYSLFMGLIMFDVMKDGPIVMFELLRRLQQH
ncbi:MAG TPA: hypothetical protein VGK74_24330 [Symbiobacteriaceae bacterium]|jgi:hypothetical protein